MDDRITIRVNAELREAIERFYKEQATPMRTRQDAYRHIIRDWLVSRGYLNPSTDPDEAS